MYMKRWFFLAVACILFLVNTSNAGNPDLKKAVDEFENDRYHNAIPHFEKVITEDSTNAEALFKLGVCYLHVFSFEESLELIEKAVALDPEVDPFHHYWHGRALHENEMFDRAIEEYEFYLDKYTNENDTRRIEILKLIDQAKVGKELSENPKYYIIENLGDSINSPYHEHSPIMTQDGQTLIFTSQREYEGHHAQDPDGHFYETIFMSQKNDDGSWSAAKPISKQLEHQGHDACIQLFDNDSKMLVYRQKKQGDFYISEKVNDVWQAPKPIEEINTGSYEVDASITQDGKRMYFATDKYTKERHLDLYYADMQENGKWGEPVALPDNINTEFDQNAPFISEDGQTLYFCSNGTKSMGGYDIFKTTFSVGGGWTDPENLGVPLNSMDDDIHYLIDYTTGKSYFASHREDGLGEMDIFSATFVPTVKINGELISSINDALIKDDSIEVSFLPVEKSRFEVESKDSLKEGKFGPELVSANTYQLLVTKHGDTLHHEIMEVPLAENEATVIEKSIVIDYEVPTEKVGKDSINSTAETQKLIVYFDYDKYHLNDSEQKSIEGFLEGKNIGKTKSVIVIGHTDSKGSTSYNLKLSKKRSKSVVRYLKKKGIDSTTSEAKGEEQPVATNDTDEGRAKNRRVEIIIK